jgi:hypothetical protein
MLIHDSFGIIKQAITSSLTQLEGPSYSLSMRPNETLTDIFVGLGSVANWF